MGSHVWDAARVALQQTRRFEAARKDQIDADTRERVLQVIFSAEFVRHMTGLGEEVTFDTPQLIFDEAGHYEVENLPRWMMRTAMSTTTVRDE